MEKPHQNGVGVVEKVKVKRGEKGYWPSAIHVNSMAGSQLGSAKIHPQVFRENFNFSTLMIILIIKSYSV